MNIAFAKLNYKYHCLQASVETKEDYLKWVTDWKKYYQAITLRQRELRKQRKPSAIRSHPYFENNLFYHFRIPKGGFASPEQEQAYIAHVMNLNITESREIAAIARNLLNVRRNLKYASAFKRLDTKHN